MHILHRCVQQAFSPLAFLWRWGVIDSLRLQRWGKVDAAASRHGQPDKHLP